jgi:hypothetical protein
VPLLAAVEEFAKRYPVSDCVSLTLIHAKQANSSDLNKPGK